MMNFKIIDTTLRDGEQTAGVSFCSIQKIKLATLLNQFGIDLIEVGIPAMGKEEQNTLKKIKNLNLSSPLLTWNRMKISDIKSSLNCGIHFTHISIPISNIHIYKKLRISKKEAVYNLLKTIDFALGKKCKISIGFEDASRTDLKFIFKLLEILKPYPIEFIRFADTMGCLNPFNTFQKIKKITSHFNYQIDFHAHNDYGMATANTYTALKAGAHYISTTINGLGERAGNTALEEILAYLKFEKKIKLPYQLPLLKTLSQYVEKFSGQKISQNKPIVGQNVFSHESGIHVDGLLKNLSTYENFNPVLVGSKRELVYGKFSGSCSAEFFKKSSS